MVTCERLGEHIGTAVTGVDLCALDESEQAAINAALAETGVVVFPRASLSEEGLLQLCEQLGDVRPHPLLAATLANPEFKVSGFSGVAVRPEGLDSRIHRLSPAARPGTTTGITTSAPKRCRPRPRCCSCGCLSRG